MDELYPTEFLFDESSEHVKLSAEFSPMELSKINRRIKAEMRSRNVVELCKVKYCPLDLPMALMYFDHGYPQEACGWFGNILASKRDVPFIVRLRSFIRVQLCLKKPESHVQVKRQRYLGLLD